MATLKLIIFPKKIKKVSKECHIYVQLTHQRKTMWLPTDIFVLPALWEEGKVVGGRLGDKNAALKNIRLSEALNDYANLLMDNKDKIKHLEVNAIKDFLTKGDDQYLTDFFKYTEYRLEQLKKENNKGTVSPLTNTLRLVREYRDRNTLNFSEITPRFLEGFTAHYIQKGHKVNSIAVYMRYIRSMFNDAIVIFGQTDHPVPI